MTELIIILSELFEFLVFLVYGITILIQISKRKGISLYADRKMINVSRILIWGSVIGISFVSKKLDNNIYHLVILTILLITFFLGTRLYILSFNAKEKKAESIYNNIDKWLEKMYRKYLEPLLQ